MSVRIRLRRGANSSLPTSGLLAGEPLFSTDRHTLHVATDSTTTVAVVPALEDLDALTSPENADYLLIHDVSESGKKEKRCTFANFKTALNIPEGGTDELVATADGQTAGYLEDVLVDDESTIDITRDGAVMTVSVPNGGIDTAQLADDAVTTGKIADNAVVTAKIADNAVVTAKIADANVTTAKIADANVTNAKLAANALDLDSSQFNGNGVTTTLSIEEIDGGSF